MLRDIIQIGDPVLNAKTQDIKDFNDPKVKQLADDLVDICKLNAATTAGLSAPQVNELLSICVCRRIDLEDIKGEGNIDDDQLWEVMINPKITKSSDEVSTFWEACLSIGVGPEQLWGPVDRPEKVEITYQTITGEKKYLSAKGFFSHVVQHEFDHLKGVLFLSYVNNPQNIWKGKDLDANMEATGDFPPIE